MAGAAKQRAKAERPYHATGNSPSETSDHASRSHRSTSGGYSSTARSDAGQSTNSHQSRSRFDGNDDPEHSSTRDPAKSRIIISNKNLDLGVSCWSTVRGYSTAVSVPARTNPSQVGTAIKIGLNTFHVLSYPSKTIYQYEVVVNSGTEKKGLTKKIWESKAVQNAFPGPFIFDGSKLAWSTQQIEHDLRITVDLDAEEGRPARSAGKENKHRVHIRQTNPVGFSVLQAYLSRQADFDNCILEAISCMDHILRESPSKRFTAINRNFFAKGQQRFSLGSGVEAFKGCFATLRVAHAGAGLPASLSVVVDVANGTFWTSQPLTQAASYLTGRGNISDLVNSLRQGDRGPVAEALRKRMKNLRVLAKHRGKGRVDEYVIDRFVYQSARDYRFEKDGKLVSLYEYYVKQYNIRLQYPDLPLVKMTKGKNTLLPMEILTIKENQRYKFKCDERQTANMIKFAVTPPSERWNAIEHGLRMLDWPNDPVLKAFGIKISTQKTVVNARLITPPKVQFGTGEARPGTSGRWDLKGKKFLSANTAPLKSWSVCVISGRRGGKPDRSVVENFVREFIKSYTNHGGRVENRQPALIPAHGDDVGSWVTMAWNSAGNQAQARPQILVFILPDKDSNTYGRIKRSAECRYGVVSQCMQYAHILKAQPQYISNVCMKFNAKLGGQTGRAVGPRSGGPNGHFNVSTMIIGGDVSHSAPGSETPSIAALTCSIDKLGIRYAAACETNGHRVEMIKPDNINNMLKPMIQYWTQTVGGGKLPSRIIYFRDGVSEGQYQHVLEQEVTDMKALLKTADPKLNIPFIVVVCSKRHHVRFFPEPGKGDRHGNPLPGTLVESGATHPFENDFYLCSHAAIKGTARPMHYHVLLNEVGMSNEELQTLIYEHCYQFIRATTPVSQHPAIYYAHIAANRAVTHDRNWGGSSDSASTVASRPRSGSPSGSQSGRSGSYSESSAGVPTDPLKLLPMPNPGNIQTSMWYI